jgi:hypothetical protein
MKTLTAFLLVILFQAFIPVAEAQPVINSFEVSPAPLLLGKPFTLSVGTSADASSVTAIVDFRPTAPRILRLILTKSTGAAGTALWTGNGDIPADLPITSDVQISVRLTVLDAVRKRTEQVKQVLLSKGQTSLLPVVAITSPEVRLVRNDHQDLAHGSLLPHDGAEYRQNSTLW